MGFASRLLDGLHQGGQLVRAASGDTGDKTFPGKTLGDCTACGIAGSDDQNDFLVLCGCSHGGIALLVNGR
jgi:hypothetical protein